MIALRRTSGNWQPVGRPAPAVILPFAPEGAIDELSDKHVAGWLFDPTHPNARIAYEGFLDGSGEVLVRGVADQFTFGLAAAGKGDGAHGFYARFPHSLPAERRGALRIRATGSTQPVAPAPELRTEYNPLLHVAMDIVDNCNLRCPFCLYDYANTNATHVMDEATLHAALRFLPYTRDGEFWFSCLHEPALHPRMTDFIDAVPSEYRRKLFFTTNLAKRMPAGYFAWMAGNGMHHINISIESRDPAIYERMRKGARHKIFMANWDALLAAMPQGSAPPKLRYIMMAYKSNLREIPDLVGYLLAERQASQIEVRYTYDVPHIPPEFKAAEYLHTDDWNWLQQALAPYPTDKVLLLAPPGEVAPPVPAAGRAASKGGAAQPPPAALPDAEERVLSGRYMFRLSWDGTLRVQGISAASRYDDAQEYRLADLNIRDIDDAPGFIDQLEATRWVSRQS